VQQVTPIFSHVKYSVKILSKFSFVFTYYFYSLRYVKHDYGIIFVKQESHTSNDVVTTTSDVVTTTSFEPFRCNSLISIPGYQDLSLCFQNYSLFNLLFDLNINSWLNNLIILPIILYTLIYFVVAKYIKLYIFLNIIICSIIPSLIGNLLGVGLNGINNEGEQIAWNIIKLFYFNVITGTTEISSFGPEFRQVSSFIIVLIIYFLLSNNNTDSIIKLIVLNSLIHIYLSILLFFLLAIFYFFGLIKSNPKFAIFYMAHTYITILIQNVNIYDYRLYIAYHTLVLFLLFRYGSNLILVRKEGRKNHRYFTDALILLFFIQILLVFSRYSYLNGLFISENFEKAVEYEKGAGIIERISTITRTLVFLFILTKLKPTKMEKV